MILHDHICPRCDANVELAVDPTAPAPACPQCGGDLRRIFLPRAGRRRGIDVGSITGVPGQRMNTAHEVDELAKKNGKIILDSPQELWRMKSRIPRPGDAREIRADLDRVARRHAR